MQSLFDNPIALESATQEQDPKTEQFQTWIINLVFAAHLRPDADAYIRQEALIKLNSPWGRSMPLEGRRHLKNLAHKRTDRVAWLETAYKHFKALIQEQLATTPFGDL